MGATSPASTALGGLPPVLRVEYPSGSYSGGTGGSQFYAQPLDTGASTSSKSKKLAAAASSGNGTSDEQYERMLLSYDIWFPSGFA